MSGPVGLYLRLLCLFLFCPLLSPIFNFFHPLALLLLALSLLSGSQGGSGDCPGAQCSGRTLARPVCDSRRSSSTAWEKRAWSVVRGREAVVVVAVVVVVDKSTADHARQLEEQSNSGGGGGRRTDDGGIQEVGRRCGRGGKGSVLGPKSQFQPADWRSLGGAGRKEGRGRERGWIGSRGLRVAWVWFSMGWDGMVMVRDEGRKWLRACFLQIAPGGNGG